MRLSLEINAIFQGRDVFSSGSGQNINKCKHTSMRDGTARLLEQGDPTEAMGSYRMPVGGQGFSAVLGGTAPCRLPSHRTRVIRHRFHRDESLSYKDEQLCFGLLDTTLASSCNENLVPIKCEQRRVCSCI